MLTALNIAYAAYEPARYMRILPGLTELVPLFAMVAAAVMLGPFIGGLIAAFLSPES